MIIIICTTILILSISSVILLALNPLTMGIVILCIAITLTLIFSSIISSWIAFLIFLIYVRGILVIFAYFVSLIPNQPTNIITTLTPLIIFTVLSSITFIFIMPSNTHTSKFINAFYTQFNFPILIILALTLLLAIIVVVKIVTNNKGPLRPFIKYV